MGRIIGGIGILLILLLAFLLLLPYFINLEPIKERILSNISQKVGGQVNYQKVELSFLPTLCVIIHQPSLSLPGKVTGALESATICPDVLPLLRGAIRISSVQIKAPNIALALPETRREKEEKPFSFSPAIIGELMAPVLALMESKMPHLSVQVENGKLNVTEGSQSIFQFQDIWATIILPPDRLEFDLTCSSNLWENLSVEGWLESENWKGEGQVDLAGLRLDLLTRYLSSPSIPLRVEDSPIDLTLSFETDSQRTLRAEVQSSIAYLNLQRGNGKVALKGAKLAGRLSMEGDKTEISLVQLILEHPPIHLSGKLQIDPTLPFFNVEVEGKEIDLVSTKQAVWDFMGDLPPVQKILEVVRGGKIPLITFKAKGRSVDELGKLGNLFIHGRIAEGKAFLSEEIVGVQGLSFELEEINGDITISKGFLEGKNLEARWGEKIKVEEGLLRWDLSGEDGPFHLAAKSEVDLAQIPPLLKRVVKDKNVLEEIEAIQELRGRARGNWVLGETLKAVGVKVDVQEIDLLARYARIPYPLEVQSGQVSYDGEKVGIKGLNAKLGRSSLSEFVARLDLKAGPDLAILSGRSDIFLDEIFPWLSSLERFEGIKRDLKSLRGTVALSNLEWKGPFFNLEKCRFRIGGEVENLAIDSSRLPGPASVPGAKFEITPETISLSDARMRILDTSFRAAGVLRDYQQGLHHIDFTFQADIGSKTMEWAWDQFHLPEKFRVRPLSVSEGRVAWDRNGKISFSGDIAAKEGPRIFTDMFYQPEEFTINRMVIHDAESTAALALGLQKRELRIDFKGNLEKTTLDRFLVNNEIFTGRLEGDFRARVFIDQPLRSTAQGKLQAAGLDYPLPLPVPVKLNQFSLEAAEQKITVASASFTWDENQLVLKGNVHLSGEEFLLDMEVDADGFKWEKVEKELKKKDQKKDGQKTEDQKIDSPQDTKPKLPPVRGNIKVRLKYFEYEKYTLKPLYAEILLDPGGIRVIVHEANVCGISIPGVVKVMLPDISLDFQLVSRDQGLKESLECLSGRQVGITGNFNFQGEIKARAKPEDLPRTLGGNFDLEAKKGQIQQTSLVIKVLSVLNITEIFFGEDLELVQKGAGYDSVKVKGDLQSGKFMIKEMVLEAPWMKMVSQGNIDLINKDIDFTLILAPLRTVDKIVSHIPIAGNILGDDFISIPVRVRGDWNDPTIIPLPPSAVGQGLLNITKRTLTFPFKLIQPVMPRSGEK